MGALPCLREYSITESVHWPLTVVSSQAVRSGGYREDLGVTIEPQANLRLIGEAAIWGAWRELVLALPPRGPLSPAVRAAILGLPNTKRFVRDGYKIENVFAERVIDDVELRPAPTQPAAEPIVAEAVSPSPKPAPGAEATKPNGHPYDPHPPYASADSAKKIHDAGASIPNASPPGEQPTSDEEDPEGDPDEDDEEEAVDDADKRTIEPPKALEGHVKAALVEFEKAMRAAGGSDDLLRRVIQEIDKLLAGVRWKFLKKSHKATVYNYVFALAEDWQYFGLRGDGDPEEALRGIWDKAVIRVTKSEDTNRPTLVLRPESLPTTVNALADILAKSGQFFERGVPVQVIEPASGDMPVARELSVSSVVMQAHKFCRPQKYNDTMLVDCTLPDRVGRLYLDGKVGEWNLISLNGVTTTPILSDDGSIRTADGYDRASGLWCHAVPSVQVPDTPTEDDARDALWRLRDAFKTFPFADAATTPDESLGVDVLDLEHSPKNAESAFLVGLMTAVCRPSLELAPGLVIRAAEYSGAGNGKGLLFRAICAIAFGYKPKAFTPGHDAGEMDKRIASQLMGAAPCVLLDNVNSRVLSSDTLASVLTERPAEVRLLGSNRMIPLNSAAFIGLTGNGLRLSEDLARRFLYCELDAKMEDPELRPFKPGFLASMVSRRAELLTAVLTIWRWGRLDGFQRPDVRPMGSYEKWGAWCRDPLVALGCSDPVDRIKAVKANDPRRQEVSQIFTSWNDRHGQAPVAAADLCEEVRQMLDPHNKGRQTVAYRLGNLVGTRAAGFVLLKLEAHGKWTAATYQLQQTAEAGRAQTTQKNEMEK
jgi:hypothetical protein